MKDHMTILTFFLRGLIRRPSIKDEKVFKPADREWDQFRRLFKEQLTSLRQIGINLPVALI